MLLILASPHVLSEPSGAGARPVHPIRVESRRCNSLVAIGGIADIGLRSSRKARVRMTQSGPRRISTTVRVVLASIRSRVEVHRFLETLEGMSTSLVEAKTRPGDQIFDGS